MKKLILAVLCLVSFSFGQSATANARTSLLGLIFNNTAADSIGDAAGLVGSTTPDSVKLMLFTADPTVSGALTDSADYTGYISKTLPRHSNGWTIADSTATNALAVEFPLCTEGENTITHIGILWRNKMWFKTTTTSTVINAGKQPVYAAGAIVFTLK